jgi:hypothetical protein
MNDSIKDEMQSCSDGNEDKLTSSSSSSSSLVADESNKLNNEKVDSTLHAFGCLSKKANDCHDYQEEVNEYLMKEMKTLLTLSFRSGPQWVGVKMNPTLTPLTSRGMNEELKSIFTDKLWHRESLGHPTIMDESPVSCSNRHVHEEDCKTTAELTLGNRIQERRQLKIEDYASRARERMEEDARFERLSQGWLTPSSSSSPKDRLDTPSLLSDCLPYKQRWRKKKINIPKLYQYELSDQVLDRRKTFHKPSCS